MMICISFDTNFQQCLQWFLVGHWLEVIHWLFLNSFGLYENDNVADHSVGDIADENISSKNVLYQNVLIRIAY